MADPQKTVPPDFTAALNNVKAAAAGAAAKIADLRDQVKAGMTPAEVTDIQGQLTAVADALTAASADPAVPPAGAPKK